MLTIDLALVICKEGEDREKAAAALLRCGLNPICCSSLQEARTLLGQEPFKVVLCADYLADGDYRAVLREVRKTDKDAPMIVLSHELQWESYFTGLGDGAFDYISCPPDAAEANRIISSAVEDIDPLENTTYLSD